MKKILAIAVALTCISMTPANAASPKQERNAAQLQVMSEKKVLQFEEAVVRNVLKEEGYDERFITEQIRSLPERDARLQPLLDAYLKDRTLSEEFVANGTTIKTVMVSEQTNFWSALICMEICIKDPRIALQIREQAQNIEADKARSAGRK